LEVLKEVLQDYLVIAPEVVFKACSVGLGHFAAGLNANLLDVRSRGRIRVGVCWSIHEFDADLDLVNPIAS
jgi:hypothetical protein